MILLTLAAAVAAPTAAVAMPAAPSRECVEARRILTGKSDQPARLRKLGELPPARSFAAVLYHNGECVVPVPVGGQRVRRR